MVKDDSDMEGNSVRKSRVQKARRFMRDRVNYMVDVVRSTELLVDRAVRMSLKPCVRMNGATDIAFEHIKCVRNFTMYASVFDAFPSVDFVDYTKNPKRFNKPLPPNYHLTFSRSETNESDCLALLARGVNVAIVFEAVPATWNGFTVIGLLPKGRKAKKDRSGFVVRNAN